MLHIRHLLAFVFALTCSAALHASDIDGDGVEEGILATQVSAGGDHSCALYANGVYCWGE